MRTPPSSTTRNAPTCAGKPSTGSKPDLALWGKRAAKDDAKAREAVLYELKQWQTAGYLAGVRDKDALEKLPGDERDEWRKLWDDVAATLRKAVGKKD